VTGASRGLGAAVARRFWAEGASLVLAVRDPASVASLVAALPADGARRAAVLTLDLADLESVKSLVPRARAQGITSLDVLVNNAAVVGPIGKLADTPPEEWASALSANLTAPTLLSGAAVAWMAEKRRGRIINLSGGGATGPRANFSAYAAAKAGIVRLSETLAEEVKDLGITVNCVAPGPMSTAMLAAVEKAGATAAGEKEVAAARRAREAGDKTMASAVELITFLASDASDGVTGKLISALWDNWADFPAHLAELSSSDVFTLRRIAGRDRGQPWGDK
jgi:3-oxoacyl-[acyl-carrier protein] reductase